MKRTKTGKNFGRAVLQLRVLASNPARLFWATLFLASFQGSTNLLKVKAVELDEPGKPLDERWVFAISAGHCGTRFLSNGKYYGTEKLLQTHDRICFAFEAGHHFKRHLTPLKSWWRQRWLWEKNSINGSSSSSSSSSKILALGAGQPKSARELVVNDLLPWYRQQCVQQETPRQCAGNGCATVHVDLGHHILMGLYPALLDTIGTSMVTFLRIRRNRTRTAASFYSTDRAPCGTEGDFVLCPWWHGSVLLDSTADFKRKWEELNAYQRCLWFVDEVEARWTIFQERTGNALQFEEFDWRGADDIVQIHSQLASVLNTIVGGGNVSHARVVAKYPDDKRKHNQHTSDADFSDAKMEEYRTWERGYDAIMQYSARARNLIARQQF